MHDFEYKPTHYKLHFIPDLTTFIFRGEEEMNFFLRAPTKQLTFDALDLTVLSVSLRNKDNQEQHITFSQNKTKDKLEIASFDDLLSGEYTLEIKFTGKNTDKLAGWYRSRVVGGEEYILTSQFEAADARRAYVCIDNPLYKATFSISMEIEKDLTAISNMPIKEEQLLGSKKRVLFEESPVMSTYLLYLGVGRFDIVEDSYNDVVLRGITTPGKAEHMKTVLMFAKQALAFFEEYFAIPYPLPKLDLIAVPDFAQAAMENWGAVVGREEDILVYERKTSITHKQWIASVIMHEIAHMWFGDLVTMKWWDDLWLNESFATFMETKAIAHLYPEWHRWTESITAETFSAMQLDGLKSSHAIQNDAKDLDSIEENFDAITYEKGASILRMLEGFVGEAALREGLRTYMNEFAYKNAQAGDLWKHIAITSHQPVERVMNSFITQVGYPEVFVEERENKIHLTQQRFTYLPNTDKSLWSIPLFQKDIDSIVFDTHKIDLENKKSLPLINLDYFGFFITSYDKSLLEKMVINKKNLDTHERLGLLHDLFSTVMAGQNSLSLYLSFVDSFLEKEENPDILWLGLSELRRLYVLLEREDVAKKLRLLSKEILGRVGMLPSRGEDTRIPILRNSSMYALGIMNDPEILSFSDQLLRNSANGKEIHPDIRPVAYSMGVRAKSEHYAFLKKRYQTITMDAEKVEILSALGFTTQEELLGETLVFALSPEVRYANLLFLSRPFISNPETRKIAFPWLKNNWEELLKRSGGAGENILQRLVKSIAPAGVALYKDDIIQFLKKLEGGVLGKAAREVEEEIEITNRFVEVNK